jgi:sec-independent protein translocase protein TatA
MFQNIGFTEILLIGIVALVLFGPQKLPEIGRMVGKTLNQFKKGARELMEDVKTEPPSQASSEPVQKLGAPSADARAGLDSRELPLNSVQAAEQERVVQVPQEENSEPVSAEVKPDAVPPRNAARRLPD